MAFCISRPKKMSLFRFLAAGLVREDKPEPIVILSRGAAES